MFASGSAIVPRPGAPAGSRSDLQSILRDGSIRVWTTLAESAFSTKPLWCCRRSRPGRPPWPVWSPAPGSPGPTAHRLAVALEHHRLVARDMQGRFVLGPRLGELAAAAGEDRLLAAAGPVLARLRDITGESAQLWRRQGDYRVCVAAAERPVRPARHDPGRLAADHARRLGRADPARLGGPGADAPRAAERRVLRRRARRHPPPRLGAVGRRAGAGRRVGLRPGALPLAARSSPPCRSRARSSGSPASPAACTRPPCSPPPSGSRESLRRAAGAAVDRSLAMPIALPVMGSAGVPTARRSEERVLLQVEQSSCARDRRRSR